MGEIASAFSRSYRDYTMAGVGASGLHEPLKRDLRQLGVLLDGGLSQLAAAFVADGATIVYATRAALFADLAYPSGALGIVWNDGERSGIYIKSGAPGSGAWTATGLMLKGAKGDDGLSFYDVALQSGYIPAGTTEQQFIAIMAGEITAAASARAIAWAEGTHPGGPGTKSAREWAVYSWDAVLREKGDPGSPGEGYATRAALALAGNAATALDDAYLTPGDIAGKFVFTAHDMAAALAGIPEAVRAVQTVIIPPQSDPSGASGAWVRVIDGPADVCWFGADRTGDVDSAPAICAAAALFPEVLAPEGEYRVAGPTGGTAPENFAAIVLPSNTILRGAGRGKTIIRLGDDLAKHVIALTSVKNSPEASPAAPTRGISISGMTIDGNRDNQSDLGQWSGIEMSWVDHFHVSDIHTLDTRGHGVSCHGARFGVIERGESERFGDDGVSVADAGLDFTDPNARYSEHIEVRDWYSHDAEVGGYAESGSGFEVDDGPRHISFRRCVAERCINSFDVHWHAGDNHPTNSPRVPGELLFEDCRSIDPVKGHYSFLSNWRVPHSGLSIRRIYAEGRPVSPNSASGALLIGNGIWENVLVDGVKAVDAGRINLRGIKGGSIDNIEADFVVGDGGADDLRDRRVDLRGDKLADGSLTKMEGVRIGRIAVRNASAVLIRDHVRCSYKRLDLTACPFLWVHSSDHLDINGWSVTGATHASYSVLIGGASETEIGNGSATGREVAVSLGAGLIDGGAGHGIYLQPSSVAQAMRDLVLEDVDVDHPMKCGLRAVTGAGGGIYNAVARGLRIDSACQNESGEVQQVVLGSDAGSIVDGFVFSGLKIRKSSGIATRGLTHNAATGVINVHVIDSDIRDSGSTSNYYDVNRIVTWARTMGGLNRRVSYDTAAPSVGLYTRGDIIWNTLPSASGKAGWVCTTGGDAASTAVFKPFASIDA